jgi:hypothetical protein
LPYFLICNAIFDHRKKKAINIAENRAKKERKRVFVIQLNRKFYTGTRDELRRHDKACYKILRKVAGRGVFDYDYRNSIVHISEAK